MWMKYSGNLAESAVCPVINDHCSACTQIHSQKFCEVTGAEVTNELSHCPDDDDIEPELFK